MDEKDAVGESGDENVSDGVKVGSGQRGLDVPEIKKHSHNLKSEQFFRCEPRPFSHNGTKFWQSGIPTRDSSSRRILKVCILGRVEARFWKPKIVISRSTITSPVWTRSNIIIHTRILIFVIIVFWVFLSLWGFSLYHSPYARVSNTYWNYLFIFKFK